MIFMAASLLVPSPGIASLAVLSQGEREEAGIASLGGSPSLREGRRLPLGQAAGEGARLFSPHLASLRLPSSPKGRGKI